MTTKSRDDSAPNPLAPILARMLGDAQLWRELLCIALAQTAEREQDYQKLQSRYIALLEQYRASRRANVDAPSLHGAKRSREAA